jgi:hypothetical protein
MIPESLWLGRYSPFLHIARACADDPAMMGQPSGDKGGIRQMGQADGDIEPLIDKVQNIVIELELKPDIGKAAQVARQGRSDVEPRECDRRRHPQHAARLLPRLADRPIGMVKFIQNAARVLIVTASRRGEADAAR